MPQDISIFFRILQNRQLEVTEEGKLVKKDRKNTSKVKEALQQQHRRQNKVRNKISLDDMMNQTGGSFG